MMSVKHAKKIVNIKDRIATTLDSFARTEKKLLKHQDKLKRVIADIDTEMLDLHDLKSITQHSHDQAEKVANNIGKILRGDL